MEKYKTIDECIADSPEQTKEILQKIRETIHQVAPKAEEAIRYGIPTFRLNDKNLVHFAGYKKHIGFYPAPSGLKAFEKELKPYLAGKGTAQFPLDKPIPYDLIKKITKYRVEEVSK